MLRLFYLLSIILCFQVQHLFCDNYKRVYLATFPRSGNHWIRYLVEEASHIATSSVYCDVDPQHTKKIFPWCGYCVYNGYTGRCRYPTENDSILIKTHFPVFDASPCDCRSSVRTIRIVRNPIDSFYSLHCHNQFDNKNEIPPISRDEIEVFIKQWRTHQDYWNKQTDVITFLYEDLFDKSKLFSSLKTILETLNYKVTNDDIKRACKKYPPIGHPYKHIGKFKKEDVEFIQQELKDLLEKFNYQIPQK